MPILRRALGLRVVQCGSARDCGAERAVIPEGSVVPDAGRV